MPAALRAIAALSRAGMYPGHHDWAEKADKYAQIWEDETLRFFQVRPSLLPFPYLTDRRLTEIGHRPR